MEFKLINLLREKFPHYLGDDCAVISSPKGKLLLTTDELVQDVHFKLNYCSLEDVGYKSVSAGCSDIAAMGGELIGVLIAIAIPDGFGENELSMLYSGVEKFCRCNCEILGGNISRTDGKLHIVVSAVGSAPRPILRSGAKADDFIYLTGTLGGALAGYFLLTNRFSGDISPIQRDMLSVRHRKPRSRINEGKLIGEFEVNSMIDISDGFYSDIMHIAEESNLGINIEIDEIPLYPGVRTVADNLGIEPHILAARSGEEYELIFTAPEKIGNKVAIALSEQFDTPVTPVGKMTRTGININLEGKPISPNELIGWEHKFA